MRHQIFVPKKCALCVREGAHAISMSLRAGEMGIRLFTALLALAVVGSSPAHAQRVTGSDLRDQVAPDCASQCLPMTYPCFNGV